MLGVGQTCFNLPHGARVARALEMKMTRTLDSIITAFRGLLHRPGYRSVPNRGGIVGAPIETLSSTVLNCIVGGDNDADGPKGSWGLPPSVV